MQLSHAKATCEILSCTDACGLRAFKPLAPVHIETEIRASGDLEIRWIRRSRVNADSWIGKDIPLGEAIEEYRVEICTLSGRILLSRSAFEQHLVLAGAEIEALRQSTPITIEFCVTQISERVGDGVSAQHRFTLPPINSQ